MQRVSPYDGMHSPGKENKDFRVEECEVVEAILPAHNGCHHEQATAGQEDGDQQNDDLCVSGRYRVRGEGELERERRAWKGEMSDEVRDEAECLKREAV